MLRDMKRSAHFKAVFDDSWITVDTTSLHRHKLCYCTIALICRILKLNSTSCVIQGPDQDLAGTHQRLRDSMSGRAEVWFRSPTGQQKIYPAEIKNRARSQAARLMNIITVNSF